ncbi:MAG: glycosyltransferase family 9 protein [Ignavibacteria bacterium]
MDIFRNIEKPLGNFFLQLLKIFIPPQYSHFPNTEPEQVKNILVILRHMMGDFLCATPMIRSLRAQYREAKITLVTKSSSNYDRIFKNDKSLVDDVYYFEYGLENFIDLVKELRGKNFEIAVIPSTVVYSATNHLFGYYSRAKIRAGVNSINYNDNRVSYLLNVKKDFSWESDKVHQIERNLDIVRQLGFEPAEKRIRININSESAEFAEKFFVEKFPDASRPVIGFHPGAGKPDNTWAGDKFAELSTLIKKEFNSYIFISEGPSDKAFVEKMVLSVGDHDELSDYCRHKGTIQNNLALINKLTLFVSNDTGMMHLASGLENLNLVALFGPSKAYEWGPLGKNKRSIQSPSNDINKLSVDKVFEVCKALLNESEK